MRALFFEEETNLSFVVPAGIAISARGELGLLSPVWVDVLRLASAVFWGEESNLKKTGVGPEVPGG